MCSRPAVILRLFRFVVFVIGLPRAKDRAVVWYFFVLRCGHTSLSLSLCLSSGLIKRDCVVDAQPIQDNKTGIGNSNSCRPLQAGVC